MKYIFVYLFFLLIPSITFGQLYKCDSTINNTVFDGGYKNGLKHGYWTYYKKNSFYKFEKAEIYWFGELVYQDTNEILYSNMFHKNDTIIQYNISHTVNYVLEQTIEFEPNEYFIYCELHYDDDENCILFFHKLKRNDKPDNIENFSKISNRGIIVNGNFIPVMLPSDRKFAFIGWVFTGNPYLYLKLNSKGLIISIDK